MTKTHLCNIFFEDELSSLHVEPFEQLLQKHPIALQLQYLPLLYRQKNERVLVTELPSLDYLKYLETLGFSSAHLEIIQTAKPPFSLELWGASRSIQAWAEARGETIRLPDWEIVREIHSKVYSYAAADSIPHSHLFKRFEDAKNWAQSFEGPKVLKKAFGASGSGHMWIENDLPDHARSLFENRLPVVCEPWVERVFDFSTQWEIRDGSLIYHGATVLKTNAKGVYLGTLAGEEDELFKEHPGALYEHVELCKPLLQKIQKMGFFGHIGIDAFVYIWNNKRRLRVVGEINARKTMGWAALEIRRLHFPKKTLHLRYEKTEEKGYLPKLLGKRTFSRQLLLDFV